MKLREWRKAKGLEQATLADKIGSNQKTYSAYETGRLKDIPPDIQAKIRKMGYTGPWPREEAQAAPANGQAPYVTEKEFWKLVGRLEKLEAAFDKLGEGFRRHLEKEPEEAHPQAPA